EADGTDRGRDPARGGRHALGRYLLRPAIRADARLLPRARLHPGRRPYRLLPAGRRQDDLPQGADVSEDASQVSPVGPRLEVRAVGRKGRGVFAAVQISAGDLLEAAPSVEIADDIVPGSGLDDYPFAHPTDPERALIVFGLVSLMNH